MRVLTPTQLTKQERLEALAVVSQLELMCLDSCTLKPMRLLAWQSFFIAEVFGCLLRELKKPKPGLVHMRLQGAYGTGKTTIIVYITLLTLLFWKKFLPVNSKFKGAVLSGSKDQLKQVFWNDLKTLAHNHNFIRHIQVSETGCRLIENPHCAIQCRVAHKVNVNSLTGVHADFVVTILDECPAIIDEVDQKIENYFTSALGLRIDTGNPLGKTGFFRRQLDNNMPGIHKYIIGRNDLGPIEDDDYASRIAAQYGPESDYYRVSVLGEYGLSESESFITEHAINCAVVRTQDLGYNHGVYMGVDIAGGDSQDYSTFAIREDYQVVKLYRNKLEIRDFTDRVIGAIEEYNVDVIVVDPVGIGSGVYQELRTRYSGDKLVVPFNGGANAFLSSRYGNRVTEIYYTAKEWLQYQGRFANGLEHLNTLLEELRMWQATTCTAKGQWTLVSKRQLPRSPDLADAFAMTFAAKKNDAVKMTDYKKRMSRKRYV